MDDTTLEEEWQREQAEEEADRLRKEEAPPAMSNLEFLEWRSPREAGENPTRLDNPLWRWLVRTQWNAYQANELMSGPSSFDCGPMWSFDRFGMSRTELEDGRVFYIGGEHEDNYDPDFYIYNDVTVIQPNGEISLVGYPRDVFPPTDFHSATRVGGSIYIIGRLGYPNSRAVGATPIYRLSLDSLRMEAVDATGQNPGWIGGHSALLMSDGHTILVKGGRIWLGHVVAPRENINSWAFDTRILEWRLVTERQ
jgi:hypothetical protein